MANFRGAAPTTRLAAADILRAGQELLARPTGVTVAAVGADGLFVPMPAHVPVARERVISGHDSALQLVTPDCLTDVIDAWRRAVAVGVSRVSVTPRGARAARMTLHFLDLREQFGVFLVAAVPYDDPVAAGPVSSVEERLPPRFCTVRKNEVSEFTEVDANFEELLGYQRIEMVGRRNLDLIHPDDHQLAIANWMDMLSVPGRSRRVRLRHQHKDGHWIWFEITNHNRLNDPLEGVVLAEMVDISNEIAAQESTRAGARLLGRLTDSLLLGVVQVDATGRVVHCNARAAELLGSADGADLTSALDGVADHEAVRIQSAIRNALASGAEEDLTILLGRPGGARRCRLTVRALGDGPGHSGALVCIDDLGDLDAPAALERGAS
jgi:PAS domain S-box-containing protein